MKGKSANKNVYPNEIDLKPLSIRNASREEFIKKLTQVKYRGYEVEALRDGRKIVITKPGGKFVFGRMRREDFLVWIYDPTQKTLWLISHKNIWEDLEAKGKSNPSATVTIIDALERVYNGEEPDDVLREVPLMETGVGESPELILKAYKWIWGQEDVNYPDGMGRRMSWEGLSKDTEGEIISTGLGINAIRERLKAQ